MSSLLSAADSCSLHVRATSAVWHGRGAVKRGTRAQSMTAWGKARARHASDWDSTRDGGCSRTASCKEYQEPFGSHIKQ